MKSYQKLISLVSLLLLMLIVLVWLGKTINMTSDNVTINSTNFSVTKTGNITATSGVIGGFQLLDSKIRASNKKVGISSSTWAGDPAFWAGNIDPWENPNWGTTTPFVVTNQGKLIAKDVEITGGNIDMLGDESSPTIRISDYYGDNLEMYPSNFWMSYVYAGDRVSQYLQKGGYYVENESTGESTKVWYNGITTPTVTQTSLESEKKNFEKYQNALEVLKNIDIYKYNLKNEEDGTKKHLGFVIGDSYNYSKEVTSKNNDGVDIYSFVSLCCKAIQEQEEQRQEDNKKRDEMLLLMQEQQKQIEELQKEIKELKGGK